MLYALNENNDKIRPEPSKKGKCPFCKSKVIACTGEIKQWYWRHVQIETDDCVSRDYKNEGVWHSTWKFLFGKEFVEIFCSSTNEKRIADVKLENELVIEIQHSHISTKKIKQREKFHKKMVWLFDATGPIAEDRLRVEKDWFHWISPRESIQYCKCPVFLDVGNKKIFEIYEIKIEREKREEWHEWDKKVYKGSGRLYSREEFKEKMKWIDAVIPKSTLHNLEDFREKSVGVKHEDYQKHIRDKEIRKSIGNQTDFMTKLYPQLCDE